MATREALLDVTARLYAEHGWRGTTTRRIAEAAGINEVTLFRQFGSKETLLLEAIQQASCEGEATRLPDVPGAMVDELVSWAVTHHGTIRSKSGIIRTCLAEWEQRPGLAPQACSGGAVAFIDLMRYFGAAQARGMIAADASIEAAGMMLINAVFMDAMTRDVMPGAQPHSPEEMITMYVELLIRGLGQPGAA